MTSRTIGLTRMLSAICIALAVVTAGLAWRTIELGAKVTAVSVAAAARAVEHKRQLANVEQEKQAAAARHRKKIANVRAKARLRRLVVAIPFVGAGAAGVFERREYLEWKEEHPEGTVDDYAAEVASASAEIVDEVLQELPALLRPEPEIVSSALATSLQTLHAPESEQP